MPTYNTRDGKGTTDELDPCIAAEIRVKHNSPKRKTYLAIVIAILVTLLTILAIALIIYFSQSGSTKNGNGAGPWYEDEYNTVNFETTTTTTTETPIDDIDDEYDDELPSNRVHGEITVVDNGPTDKFNDDFAPMTPSGNPYLEEPQSGADVHSAIVFPPVKTTASVSNPPHTSRFVPVATSPEPVATRATIEVSTYSTNSDEIPDIVPSFSSIDDRKYDFIETDDIHENCEQYKKAGHDRSGVYEIKVGEMQFRALCLMEADYAWMVLQRRSSGSLSFNKTFDEYADGFGSPSLDHWLGLEKVYIYSKLGHRLQMRIELRGDLCNENNKCSGLGRDGYWWGDWNFSLGSRKVNYKLVVEPTVHGNLSDSSKDPLYELNNGQQFTTVDSDNDKSKGLQCSLFRKYGAWWHRDCTFVALNGEYGGTDGKTRGMHWFYQKKSDQNGVLISYAIKPEKSLIKFRIKA